MEIERQYVSFEQARKLKDKQYYNQDCLAFYYKRSNQNEQLIENEWDDDDLKSKTFTLAPEYWQVIEWLRIKHGIWIQPQIEKNILEWWVEIFKIEKIKNSPIINDFEIKSIIELSGVNSPEEATSEAIDYVLENLI